MKRILLLAGLFFLFFLLPLNVLAHDELTGEHIESFDNETTINKDGTIDVTETIVYNFDVPRHGIFRTIPYIKRNIDDKRFKMDLKVTTIEDETGRQYQYTTEYEGDSIKLKIGDPNRTITGEHLYLIKYQVKGALTYFSDHDEFYWNATGNDWPVPIGYSKSIIHFPAGIASEQIGTICYTRYDGSSDQKCDSHVTGSVATIETTEVLSSNQGLTIAVKFPPDIVTRLEPTEVVSFFDTLIGRFTLVGIGIFAIFWYVLLPFWFPIKWWTSGRDPKGNVGVTRAWFDPPKTKSGRPLSPAETGTLIDEHAGMPEISALIINLAQRGYFKIVEKGKDDYEFVLGKINDQNSLQAFEKRFIKDVFVAKTVVRLKDAKLASTVDAIQKELYEQLVKEGYFPENPDKVRQRYMMIAGIAAVTFNFFLMISASVFGRIMPKKTIEGIEAANVSRSLKNYLTSQERQLKFQAEKQMMFEKLLPFAIAFGVEKIWAERFKDVPLQQPDWYQGTYVGGFNAHSFIRNLNSSLSSFRSAATPISSSTGHSSGFSGGSSGGGGGGGGGGSW